jgi:hypothetical protein
MSELRTPPYAATEEMIAEYVRRCDILMRDVFFASDAVMLLHDAPLYTIGRYIGKNPSQMSAHVIEHATQISIQNGWTKT